MPKHSHHLSLIRTAPPLNKFKYYYESHQGIKPLHVAVHPHFRIMGTKFEANHFASGRFRLAYRGTYTEPRCKEGKRCVVKKRKDSYTWEPTDWKETLHILKKSKKLASGFNSFTGTSRPVKFADVEIQQVTEVTDNSRCRLKEYVTVEEYISGNYIKWANNYGSIDPRDTFLPAFMHWSWAHTKGKTMIADLQGVKRYDSYYLTDPCLLSATHGGKYGCTDMGIEGMAMFFLNHKCDDICSGIPMPCKSEVSRRQIAAALRAQRQISVATAYTHEMSFPKEIRDALIRVFKQIARTADV